MILKRVMLVWNKSKHGFTQGIKGRENYKHYSSEGYYNGKGAAWLNKNSELFIEGYGAKNKKYQVDVKELLTRIGRKKMSEKLYWELREILPETLEIDDTTETITQESLNLIAENYHQKNQLVGKEVIR